MNICMMNIYVFHGLLAFLCIIKNLKKNIIFVFHALYSINYVKSVGVTNLFLLQYRVPPELTEFKKRQIVSLISYEVHVQYYLSRESLVKFRFWIFRREGKIVHQFDLYHFWIPDGKKKVQETIA